MKRLVEKVVAIVAHTRIPDFAIRFPSITCKFMGVGRCLGFSSFK
jgi:hypothetical protein